MLCHSTMRPPSTFKWPRLLQRLPLRPPLIFSAVVIICVCLGYHAVILPLYSNYTKLWKLCINGEQHNSYNTSLCANSHKLLFFSKLPRTARMSGDIINQLPSMRPENAFVYGGGGVDDSKPSLYGGDDDHTRKPSFHEKQPPLRALGLPSEEEEYSKPTQKQHEHTAVPNTVASEYGSHVPYNMSQHLVTNSEDELINKRAESQQSYDEEEIAEQAERAAKLMKGFRKNAGSVNTPIMNNKSSCEGKRVFIYSLPTKFNEDLLKQCNEGIIPWENMCDFLTHSGMGKVLDVYSSHGSARDAVLVPKGVWYQTHMYMLEVLFHERLKHYPCLVQNGELADLFYVPYYGGLDVLRWHFRNVSNARKDLLGLELIRWLQEKPTWTRNGGVDHVLVLGKITWDFRRMPDDRWGSNFLLQDKLQNVTKLLIERDPWQEHEIGVPHPTFFHPRDDKDIRMWQAHIERAERRHFVSFAGMSRPHKPDSIRSHVIRQCLGNLDGSCFFFHCGNGICLQPNTTMGLFIHSEFCLQPPGDSATRRSIFDSLIGGCIPVLFDPDSAYYQYPWHLPADADLYSVYIPGKDVVEGRINVIEQLRKVPESERDAKRRYIIHDIMPGLVYAMPGAKLREVDDAFTISLKSLLSMVSLRLENELGKA